MPLSLTTSELAGTVQSILYRSEEDFWTVAALSSGDVVCGRAEPPFELKPDLAYRFLGQWDSHARHGEQFKFTSFTLEVPHTREGVVAYLVRVAPNVGEVRAQRLWDAYGSNAVEVLREQPEKVSTAGILSFDQACEAATALADASELEAVKIDLYGLFAGRGFHGSLMMACIKKWGANAARQVRANPYRLLIQNFPSAGFRRCDRLYLDLGYPAARLKRQMLCAWHSIREDSEGHTWHLGTRICDRIADSIGSRAMPGRALKLGIRSGWLARHRDHENRLWIAECNAAKDEATIARKVLLLQKTGPLLWPEDAHPTLSTHQAETVGEIRNAMVCILAGTPGTGKTFTFTAMVQQLLRRHGKDAIAICAPTGKAAVRCTSNLKRHSADLEATTIHRLLEVSRNGRDGKGWGFDRNENNPLEKRFVFVDEASMLDTDLAAKLFAACSPKTHVMLIGDPYQLPPVGHGAPLRDLIAAQVPCGELTEIQRNAGMIVHACRAIKEGKPFKVCETFDVEIGMNLKIVETANAKESVDRMRLILAEMEEQAECDPVWDAQVLVAVNKKSELSRRALNEVLQQDLNPTGEQVKGNPFRVGDKIICLRNSMYPGPGPADPSYFVANGDMGVVTRIEPKVMYAEFNMPQRLIKILMGKQAEDDDQDESGGPGQKGKDEPKGRGCPFDLAYAVTTHKMQGSEAKLIICMIDDEPSANRVTSREWWYTAISRAQKFCVLIGKRSTLEKQCRRVSLGGRKTFLKEILQDHGSGQGS